jgi:hypothetical protein
MNSLKQKKKEKFRNGQKRRLFKMTKSEKWSIEKGYHGLKELPGIFDLLDEYSEDVLLEEKHKIDYAAILEEIEIIVKDNFEDETDSL